MNSFEDGENIINVTSADIKPDYLLEANESTGTKVDDVGRMCSADNCGPRFIANEPVDREETGVDVAKFDKKFLIRFLISILLVIVNNSGKSLSRGKFGKLTGMISLKKCKPTRR